MLFISVAISSSAQSGSLSHFVPKGWKITQSAEGDLNKDKRSDKVLIIENTDSDHIIPNQGLGMDPLNTNPRTLLILFQQPDGSYRLAAKNDKGFIPSPNDAEATCLADPLQEEGGVIVEKGVLKIRLNYWYSCGSWYVSNLGYTFRYQNDNFELIGYDRSDFHRASGQSTETSINFSTRKKSETTGLNQFEESEPQTKWSKISNKKVFLLPELDDDSFIILDQI